MERVARDDFVACENNNSAVSMDAVTVQLAPWHWRDKFDARNPEEANRQQLLKVLTSISGPGGSIRTRWLQCDH